MENTDNFKNALLLYSIFTTQASEGSTIKSIVAYADYINHSIMTYTEFSSGIRYLLKNKLVKEVDKKLFADDQFAEWFMNEYENRKRIYLLKAVEKIQKYLNKLKIQTDNDAETEITEADFENGVEEYLQIYKSLKRN
jgi:hypothetical protein